MLALVAVAFVALAVGGGGYAQGQTEAQVQSRTAELEAAIRAETKRIGRTQAGLNRAGHVQPYQHNNSKRQTM